MALDGIYLSLLAREFNKTLESARVDRIMQPERDEIDIVFRLRGGSARLLLSASANNPRVHFTSHNKENPASPPMFCMLLRKHLSGGKFAGVRQAGFERILFFDLDCYNELGDPVRKTIAVEIMGRHSNIILIDENGRITDAVKHIDETMSRERQVLPGLRYELPPQQDKLSILTEPSEIIGRIRAHKECEIQKALLDTLQGVSPVVCRELSQLACRDSAARTGGMSDEDYNRLRFFIERTAQGLQRDGQHYCAASDAKTGKPMDFAFLEITQYGLAASTRDYDSPSALLDDFYLERDRVERVNQRAHDILNLLTKAYERINRKIGNQQLELQSSVGRERLKVFGDLISSNLYRLQKGTTSCTLENYYEDNLPVNIALDPSLTPVQNAQKYYREYRKASAAEGVLREQIAAGEAELEYLDSVFDELSRASGEAELSEIREELEAEGYLRNRSRQRGKNRNQPMKANKPLHYGTAEGFEIFVGRNNRQNDRLTLKTAAKGDLWLHTHNIPGAHVIVVADGRNIPDSVVTLAAKLAAAHSKARESAKVPVDYTSVRNVKKPAGAKPGMVIYDHYNTAYVDPDENAAGQSL